MGHWGRCFFCFWPLLYPSIQYISLQSESINLYTIDHMIKAQGSGRKTIYFQMILLSAELLLYASRVLLEAQ
jgi:hypothetical protein